MERTRRRDAEFSELVAATSTRLLRSAYLLTGSLPEAEDLVQTALAKAYAAWWRVHGADDPVAYVHGIVIKTFISSRRRRSSTELPIAEVPQGIHHDPDLAERAALLAALRELAPLDRAVVVLRFWEDRSISDTADALALSEAAVKNRSLRALRSLRGLLTSVPSSAPSPTPVPSHHPTRPETWSRP